MGAVRHFHPLPAIRAVLALSTPKPDVRRRLPLGSPLDRNPFQALISISK
jgi:hypothetical protein